MEGRGRWGERQDTGPLGLAESLLAGDPGPRFTHPQEGRLEGGVCRASPEGRARAGPTPQPPRPGPGPGPAPVHLSAGGLRLARRWACRDHSSRDTAAAARGDGGRARSPPAHTAAQRGQPGLPLWGGAARRSETPAGSPRPPQAQGQGCHSLRTPRSLLSCGPPTSQPGGREGTAGMRGPGGAALGEASGGPTGRAQHGAAGCLPRGCGPCSQAAVG